MPVIQQTTGAGNGSAVLSLTGVAAGRSLVVAVAQVASALRTYSASSDLDGALGSVVQYAPDRVVAILALHDVSAGNHTVTVTANTGTVAIDCWLFEVDGLDDAASPIIPTGNGVTDGGSVNTHYSAPSGEIDTIGATWMLSVGAIYFPMTATAAGASPWTKATTAANVQAFAQYGDFPSASTDERGQWTHTGTARLAASTMAAFPLATGGGGDTTLGADLAATSTTTGELATAISLAAAPQASATLGAALATELSLSATLTSTAACTGALQTSITAAASLSASATLTPTLTTAVTLASDLATTSAVAGALETALSLACALGASSTLGADLATDSTLASSLSTTSTLTAALATELSLAASATSTASLTADLDTAVTLAADWSTAATLTADLTAGAGLASGLTSTATLSAALATQITGAAACSAVSALSASLTTAIWCSAGLDADATLAGDLATVSLSQPVNIAAVLVADRAARAPGRVGAIVPGRTGAQVPRGE